MIIDSNNSLSGVINTYSQINNSDIQKKTYHINKEEHALLQSTQKIELEKTDKLGNLIDKSNTDNYKYNADSQIDEKIIQAIEEANKKVLGPNIELNFKIHEKTKRISIKVINQETKEVIREIPPEKLLDIIGYISNYKGNVLDVKK